MSLRALIALSAFCLLALSIPAAGQFQGDPNAGKAGPKGDQWFKKKKSNKPENTRSVDGVVKGPDGELVGGAIVKLKDTKTLEVRSFITLDNGSYRFHGLSTENDYELQASHKNLVSKTRRVSVYNTKKKLTIDLKLNKPKA